MNRVYWICKTCGDEFDQSVDMRSLLGVNGVVCPECFLKGTTAGKQFNPNEMIEAKAKEYGDFRKRMQIEADMWSGFLSLKLGQEVKLTMADVGIMYCLGKISRQGFKDKQDNLEDAATYMMLAVKSREDK